MTVDYWFDFSRTEVDGILLLTLTQNILNVWLHSITLVFIIIIEVMNQLGSFELA